MIESSISSKIVTKNVLEFALLILVNNICDNHRASPIFISGLTKLFIFQKKVWETVVDGFKRV